MHLGLSTFLLASYLSLDNSFDRMANRTEKPKKSSNSNTPTSPQPGTPVKDHVVKSLDEIIATQMETTPLVVENVKEITIPEPITIEIKPPVIPVPVEDTAQDSKRQIVVEKKAPNVEAKHLTMPIQELKRSEQKNSGNMMVWVMIGLLMVGWVVSCGWMSIQIMELRNQISHTNSLIQSQEMKFLQVLSAVEHASKSFDQKLLQSETRLINTIEKTREETRAKPEVKQQEPIVERKIQETVKTTVPESPTQHKPKEVGTSSLIKDYKRTRD